MNVQQQIVKKIQMVNENFTPLKFVIRENPDFVFRKEVEEKIKENDGFCLSAFGKDESMKCICEDFKRQSNCGFCKCGRYYKVATAPIVCLCGSTRFKEKFYEVAREFTLKGYIVLMPQVFIHQGDEDITQKGKEYLDELHKVKIDMADLVYIINCGKYVGDSTKQEIEWAELLNKKIEYLE